MQLWLCDDGLQAKPFSVAARKLESAAEVVAATATAGETILCCRKEIRIGRGSRCCHGYCRRNHSLLPQGKLESAAEDRRRYGRCKRAILLCRKEN